MLSENGIRETIESIVERLTAGDLFQAELQLDTSEFWRLFRPVQPRDKGSVHSVDPSDGFGFDRVHETGDHLKRCLRSVRAGDTESALAQATAALDCWDGQG